MLNLGDHKLQGSFRRHAKQMVTICDQSNASQKKKQFSEINGQGAATPGCRSQNVPKVSPARLKSIVLLPVWLMVKPKMKLPRSEICEADRVRVMAGEIAPT